MSFANGRHTAGKNSTEWMETCNMIKEKMRGYEKWCKKLQLIMVSPASERRFWNAGFHLTVALFLSEGGAYRNPLKFKTSSEGEKDLLFLIIILPSLLTTLTYVPAGGGGYSARFPAAMCTLWQI